MTQAPTLADQASAVLIELTALVGRLEARAAEDRDLALVIPQTQGGAKSVARIKATEPE